MIFEDFQGKAYPYLTNTYTRCRNQKLGYDSVCYIQKGGRGGLQLYNVVDKELVKLFLINTKSLPEWEFFTPKLGYVKIVDNWYYMTRKANRTWHVGLARSNTEPRCDRFDIMPLLEGLNKAKMNEYDRAIPGFLPNRMIAVSQKYAIDRKQVFYCGESLGNIVNNQVSVATEFEAMFHNQNIQSLIGVEFVHKKLENPFEEDV